VPLLAVLVLVHVPANGLRFAVLLHGVQLGASPALIGLLGACFFVLPMLLALRMGRLVDRIGARGPLRAACLAISASAAIGVFADSMALLFALSFVGSIGQNLYVVSTQRAVGEHGSGVERAVSYSLLGLAYSIASFVAPVLAGLAIQHGGVRAAYVAATLVPFFSLALLARRRLQLPGGHGRKHAAAPGQSASALDLLRHGGLRRTYLVGALFETSWSLFAFLSPVYGAQLGLPAAVIGLVTGSMSASTIAVRFAIPAIVRRVPMWRLLIGSLTVLAAGYLGFSLVATPFWLVFFGLVIGVGQSVGGPLINAHLFEISPEGRAGEAIGLRTTFNSTLAMLIPLTSGAVTAAIGIAPAFWALAAALGSGAWLTRREWRRARL
jgi:MFS family permease